MSERIQRNAETLREHMLNRYDDGFHHKHNKCHLPYRMHWPSHPSHSHQLINKHDQTINSNESISEMGKKIIKKTRLRIVKHRIH